MPVAKTRRLIGHPLSAESRALCTAWPTPARGVSQGVGEGSPRRATRPEGSVSGRLLPQPHGFEGVAPCPERARQRASRPSPKRPCLGAIACPKRQRRCPCRRTPRRARLTTTSSPASTSSVSVELAVVECPAVPAKIISTARLRVRTTTPYHGSTAWIGSCVPLEIERQLDPRRLPRRRRAPNRHEPRRTRLDVLLTTSATPASPAASRASCRS